MIKLFILLIQITSLLRPIFIEKSEKYGKIKCIFFARGYELIKFYKPDVMNKLRFICPRL